MCSTNCAYLMCDPDAPDHCFACDTLSDKPYLDPTTSLCKSECPSGFTPGSDMVCSRPKSQIIAISAGAGAGGGAVIIGLLVLGLLTVRRRRDRTRARVVPLNTLPHLPPPASLIEIPLWPEVPPQPEPEPEVAACAECRRAPRMGLECGHCHCAECAVPVALSGTVTCKVCKATTSSPIPLFGLPFTECVLCMDSDRTTDMLLGCGHMFCRQCLFEFQGGNCPVCRAGIRTEIQLQRLPSVPVTAASV
eukprot:TRINITY_DN4156_c0_g1_i3.p3 TRINITY_DN4156_c0_g1~~TRINITY_DN4156_c0_g1_i3.p3  ORF type:complete len:249 (+),score=10.85 TRINITY_DN4156_c0_g1_i3:1287-2033(+)